MRTVWKLTAFGTVRAVPMLRLVVGGKAAPVTSRRNEPIRFQADEAPVMTATLGTVLAELIRDAMERRHQPEEPAA